jgi:two-component system, NtrC family, sensor histidine kinase HydH
LWHNPDWDIIVALTRWTDGRAVRWIRIFQLQDLVWVLLFGIMIAFSPTQDTSEITLLAALALVQIAEPKLPFTRTRRGKITWVTLKLVLAYLLIGITYGLNSSYYVMLLLPVVSAATSLGVWGTLLFSLLACGSYLSFLLFVDWTKYWMGPEATFQLAVHAIFIAMVGILASVMAEEVRVQSGQYQKVAEQLVEANQNLREAEDAVRRSDRLAALGQLSAGLAHELRNPLGTIKASAEMLARSVAAENDVAREVAGFISTEVDRTNALVTRFLDFARPLKLQLAPGDLAQVLDRAVELVERDAAGRRVAIFKNYSPDIPPLPMDAALMERVFYNLLINAVQATPAEGAVTIKTRGTAGTAEICVIDRGSGIDPKLMSTIFNPFVTTKPEGVGLGLAIVSKIVDEHGGRISVESDVGKGSVFRVHLPMIRESRAS